MEPTHIEPLHNVTEPTLASHTIILPSRELVCMKPSPPHFTQVTGRVWPDRVYIHRRVLASHTLAVPSCEAVANCRQGISTCAGCQAIDMMHLEWPAGKYRCLSVTCLSVTCLSVLCPCVTCRTCATCHSVTCHAVAFLSCKATATKWQGNVICAGGHAAEVIHIKCPAGHQHNPKVKHCSSASQYRSHV